MREAIPSRRILQWNTRSFIRAHIPHVYLITVTQAIDGIQCCRAFYCVVYIETIFASCAFISKTA